MNPIVIVTGTSTGIGRDAVFNLAKAGFELMAGVRKREDFVSWKRVTNVTPLMFDVTDAAAIKKAVEEVHSRLDEAPAVHLVNNAGLAMGGPVEAVSIEKWKEQFEVNVFGLLQVTQAFLPYIRKTKGRIVNISSVSGLAAMPYLGPYCASKFAVEAISDSLRRELRQFGVKVVAIEPAGVDTPIWEKGLGRKEEMAQMDGKVVSLYQKELHTFLKLVEHTAKEAVPVARVSDTIQRALTSARPKARYFVGPPIRGVQAKLASLIPDRWMDSLIAKQLR